MSQAPESGGGLPFDPRLFEELRATGSGDAPFFESLLASFREVTSRYIERLRGALGDGDHASVVKTAHALKGSAGSFGATRLSGLASSLEAAGRGGELPGSEFVLRLEEETTSALGAARAWLDGDSGE